ncbi:MAG: hypothetical protein ACSHW0_15650 [Thalassotalea sp.]
MISAINSGSPMQAMPTQPAPMTTEQRSSVEEILKNFSADDLSATDASSIVEQFSTLGIKPSKELETVMADYGFDAKSIGDMAKANGTQMPPPPLQSDVTNSNELVSFLEELLASFDDQLTDDDKDKILAAVQEKFPSSVNTGLVNLKA